MNGSHTPLPDDPFFLALAYGPTDRALLKQLAPESLATDTPLANQTSSTPLYGQPWWETFSSGLRDVTAYTIWDRVDLWEPRFGKVTVSHFRRTIRSHCAILAQMAKHFDSHCHPPIIGNLSDGGGKLLAVAYGMSLLQLWDRAGRIALSFIETSPSIYFSVAPLRGPREATCASFPLCNCCALCRKPPAIAFPLPHSDIASRTFPAPVETPCAAVYTSRSAIYTCLPPSK